MAKFLIFGGGGLVLALFVFIAWDVFPNEHNRAATHQVVEAIEKYKSSTGQYPRNLDDLQPAYLQKLPPLAGGGRWFYTLSKDGQGYTVEFFGEGRYGGTYYRSPDGRTEYIRVDRNF